MRATIQGLEVEGTPEEIAAFAALFRKVETDSSESSSSGKLADAAHSEEEITEAFAYRVFNRRPLSKAQKIVLAGLERRHPRWTLASELQKENGWNGTQLGGVLGGLGRRLTATKGYKKGYHLWEWQWDEDEGEWAYRLPDVVLSALQRTL